MKKITQEYVEGVKDHMETLISMQYGYYVQKEASE